MNTATVSKKKLLLLGVGLVVAIVIATYFYGGKKSDIIYRPVKVERGDLDVTVLSTGAVAPENRVDIKAPIAGRMDKLLVDEGYIVHTGQIIAWMSSTERAAMLDAATALGPEEVKHWEELYRPTPIIAPLDGTIILREIQPGQTFATTDSILVMSDRLTVQAQVDETDIAQVKLKQNADIILDAYSDKKIPAKVDKIAYDAKTISNVTTYVVDVLPIKTPKYMRSGMTANVIFYIESKKDVLYVPTEAIHAGKHHTTVMMQDSNSKPLEREVTVGTSNGKMTEILSGLTENDTVLVAQVQVKERSKNGASPLSPMGGGGRGVH